MRIAPIKEKLQNISNFTRFNNPIQNLQMKLVINRYHARNRKMKINFHAMHPTSASQRMRNNQISGTCILVSSVRVILTCSPSGHSEERDEREEMILRELDLSVLVATTPTKNPALTPYWCTMKHHNLAKETLIALVFDGFFCPFT